MADVRMSVDRERLHSYGTTQRTDFSNFIWTAEQHVTQGSQVSCTSSRAAQYSLNKNNVLQTTHVL
jgi:hypothetical protein